MGAGFLADPDKKRTQSPEARATWTDPALVKRAMAAVRGLEATGDKYAQLGSWNSTADQLEAKFQTRRKQLAATNTADSADLAIKDATSGRLMRRARTGSGRSALGQFDVSKPLGPDSILGGE